MYTEENNKKINYYLKLSGIILIAVSAIFVLVLSGTLSRYLSSNSQTKTITVTGYADENFTPNMRTLYVAIVGKGKDEKTAQASASNKSIKIAEILKSKNISDADIKTQNISTYPEYKNSSDCPVVEPMMEKAVQPVIYPQYRPCVQNSVIVGYNTNQSVEVTLRNKDMDNAGELVALLTTEGVTVQTGEATIENPEKLKTDLRTKAIMDARKNAEKLADALDVRLGDVQYFSEDGSGYPMMYGDNMVAKSVSARPEATPTPVISNGSQKLTSTVSVTFEIR